MNFTSCKPSMSKSFSVELILLFHYYTFQWKTCETYYSKDKEGNLYRTDEDKLTEVLTEQLKTRYSSYVSYINNFVRISNARRNLQF